MAKFEKGNKANPAGRPKGQQDPRTALRALFQPHAPELIQKAVDLALDGDPQALRMCLDRICPSIKATADPINTGLSTTGLTLAQQADELYRQAAAGEIDLDTAESLTKILTARIKIDEVTDLSERMAALEAGNHGKS